MAMHNFNSAYIMLVYAAFSVGVLANPLISPDQGYDVPNDTVQCVNDLMAWCDGMKYPQEGAGMSMVSITIDEPNGYFRALCIADMDGTNCTRNGNPWFSCSKDNTLSYKGQPLSQNSTEGTDNEICKTTDKAFNDLFVQNLSYNNVTLKSTLEKGMEGFFQRMVQMQDEIEYLRNQVFKVFGDGFPFGPSPQEIPLISTEMDEEMPTDTIIEIETE